MWCEIDEKTGTAKVFGTEQEIELAKELVKKRIDDMKKMDGLIDIEIFNALRSDFLKGWPKSFVSMIDGMFAIDE